MKPSIAANIKKHYRELYEEYYQLSSKENELVDQQLQKIFSAKRKSGARVKEKFASPYTQPLKAIVDEIMKLEAKYPQLGNISSALQKRGVKP